MSNPEITSVAYKKGNWVRYGLWAIVAALLVASGVITAQILKEQFSSDVPKDYKFLVADEQTEAKGIHTTYYVYDNSIIVKQEKLDSEPPEKTLVIYNDIDTSSLVLNTEETTNVCDSDACYHIPKVVASIKKIIANRASREY